MELQNGQNVVGVVQPQQQIEQIYVEKVKEQSKQVESVGELQIDKNLYNNISKEIENIQRSNEAIATEQIKIDRIDQVMSSGGVEELQTLDSREASKFEQKLQSELQSSKNEKVFLTTVEEYRDEAKISIDNSYKEIEKSLNDISSKRGVERNSNESSSIEKIFLEYRLNLQNGETSSDKIYQSSILQQQLGALLG